LLGRQVSLESHGKPAVGQGSLKRFYQRIEKRQIVVQVSHAPDSPGGSVRQPTCDGQKRQRNRNSESSQKHEGEHAGGNVGKTARQKPAYFELPGIGSTILKGDLRTLHGSAVVKRKQTTITDGKPDGCREPDT